MKTELQKLYELLTADGYEVETRESTYDHIINLEKSLIETVGADQYTKSFEDNLMQAVSDATCDGWMSGFLYAMSLIGRADVTSQNA